MRSRLIRRLFMVSRLISPHQEALPPCQAPLWGVHCFDRAPSRHHSQESMPSKKLYRIIFTNQGKVYEIYARNVNSSNIFGFIEIEKIIFGERTSLVVDPSEEKIKTEFSGVTKTNIPMHSVLRIDEVDKQGISKISKADGDNITHLPGTVYLPKDKPKE